MRRTWNGFNQCLPVNADDRRFQILPSIEDNQAWWRLTDQKHHVGSTATVAGDRDGSLACAVKTVIWQQRRNSWQVGSKAKQYWHVSKQALRRRQVPASKDARPATRALCARDKTGKSRYHQRDGQSFEWSRTVEVISSARATIGTWNRGKRSWFNWAKPREGKRVAWQV